MKKILLLLVLIGASASSAFAQNDLPTPPEATPYILQGVGGYRWVPGIALLSCRDMKHLIVFDPATQQEIFRGEFKAREYRWVNQETIVTVENGWSSNEGVKKRIAEVDYYSVDISAKQLTLDSTTDLPVYLKSAQFTQSTLGNVALVSYDRTSRVFPAKPVKPSERAPQELFVQALIAGGQGLDSPRDVQLVDAEGNIHSTIVSGVAYFFPKLSPTGEFVSCYENAELVILRVNGQLVERIGSVAGAEWSLSGRRIYYNRPVQGGHDGGDIVASELFVYSIDTDTEEQLTFTDDVIELYPRASYDDKYVAYQAYKSPESSTQVIATGISDKER